MRVQHSQRHRHESRQNCGKNPTQEKRKKMTLRHVRFSPLGKNELVNRFQSEALELASSGSASAEKMASIEQNAQSKLPELRQESNTRETEESDFTSR